MNSPWPGPVRLPLGTPGDSSSKTLDQHVQMHTCTIKQQVEKEPTETDHNIDLIGANKTSTSHNRICDCRPIVFSTPEASRLELMRKLFYEVIGRSPMPSNQFYTDP